MRIVVLGAGGQGLVVVDMLLRAREAGGADEAVAVLDDDPAQEGRSVLGLRVAGPRARLAELAHDAVVVAIGDNARRRAAVRELLADGERIGRACHPRASVAPDVTIPPGAMISAGAVVLPGVVLGDGVLLNTGCVVEHETHVGAFAHVSSGATVGARCRIGAETLVGLGASVLSGVAVGRGTIVGAGSVVVRDLPDAVVAFGNPARVVRPTA